MDFHYAPEVLQPTERLQLLKQASALLDTIPAKGSDQFVKAVWSRGQDQLGHNFDRLSLRDYSGEVYMDFTPDELQRSRYMKSCLAHLWGELLKLRNDQQHEKVLLMISQATSESVGE